MSDDSDEVLAAAERRRRRWLVLGTVAVIALLGIGVALTTEGGGRSPAPTAGGLGRSAVSSSPVGTPSSTSDVVGSPVATDTPDFADCPPRAPAIATPSVGAPGTAGPLFGGPVARLTLCGYPARTSGPPSSTQVGGDTAHTLVGQLERAATRPAPLPGCAASPGHSSALLAIEATSAEGVLRPAVVVRFDCLPNLTTIATNGTAVRYGWTPPPWVLRLVRPGAVPIISVPAGRVTGSPPRR